MKTGVKDVEKNKKGTDGEKRKGQMGKKSETGDGCERERETLKGRKRKEAGGGDRTDGKKITRGQGC